jgi:hypothetical protein
VAAVGLQAVKGQDDPALPGEEPLQARGVGQRGREQLVGAVEQVGDGALRDRHTAAAQRRVDLGHGAVLVVAQCADQRDHVEAELVLGERPGGFGLGPVGRRWRAQPAASQRRIFRRRRTVPASVTRVRRFS